MLMQYFNAVCIIVTISETLRETIQKIYKSILHRSNN